MTTIQSPGLRELQPLVTNALPLDLDQDTRLTGILGDVPSTYAKSPRLWNAAFQALNLPARFLPLDIPAQRLGDVVATLRRCDTFLGGSVTVPYKMSVIPLLDEVDSLTARIGAVNVIVRTPEGRLIGHNTDGLGGVRALTDEVLPGPSPRIAALTTARVLLMGAGGAAQALSVYLWEQMSRGELLIANRTCEGAEQLVQRLLAMRAGRVRALTESEIPDSVSGLDLLVNATVKGQAGLRKLPNGTCTYLEPYSSLGPAAPAAVPTPSGTDGAFSQAWFARSAEDLQRNHEASLRICERLPASTICYDIIYAPLETTFLRHARWSGHPTLNGKAMNVVQAVEAFVRYVCHDWLATLGRATPETTTQVTAAMAEEWAR